jgi:hypothetical protein
VETEFREKLSRITFLNGKSEPARAHCRFGGMGPPDAIVHTAILVIGVLGILISLAGIAFWWVSRKMNRLT